VTKGSFYWHSASRDALITAAIGRWERDQLADLHNGGSGRSRCPAVDAPQQGAQAARSAHDPTTPDAQGARSVVVELSAIIRAAPAQRVSLW
jgi:AcrR family transcriptional regulator